MRNETDAEGMRYLQELKDAVDAGYAEPRNEKECWWVVCGGFHGRAGVPSDLVLEEARTSIGNDDVLVSVKVRNDSPWPSGGLTAVVWYCEEPYDGGTVEGHAVAKVDVVRGLRSGRSARAHERVKFAGDPPPGEYYEVVVLYEAMSDAKWVAVSWLTMPNKIVRRPVKRGFFGALSAGMAKGALDQDRFRDPWTTRLEAKRGPASKVSLSGVSWRTGADWSRIAVEFGKISISSDTPRTGSMKVVFWLADAPFEPGKPFSAHRLGSAPFRGDPFELGFENGFEVDGAAAEILRSGNAPAGEYWAVVTVNEYHESGKWYIVGHANFPTKNRYQPA